MAREKTRQSKRQSAKRPSGGVKARGPRRDKPRPSPSGAALTVVGIGASAGGLTALRTLFEAMPNDTGMAFVVIQHLDPQRPSHLVELLSSYTSMAVELAADGTEVAANKVYVVAPKGTLTIDNLRLRIRRERRQRGARMQIDGFFRSLASARGPRSIAVILSGTGTDGTLGARAIKEAGGLVVAQDPEGAEFDGMPRSAINAATADLVLAVSDMPAALARYSRQRYLRQPPVAHETLEPADDSFSDIVDLLRKETASDFTLYKPGTLERRIQRRMAMRYVESAKQYLDVLRRDPDEIGLLYKDLLINVTGFFRDSEAFAFLCEKVLPGLIQGKESNGLVRVWVAGCSTGEEAYSLAMLLIETTAAAKKNIKIQIFASDIDEDALATARLGVYPKSIEADVSEARRDRFFAKEDHSYRIRPELRETIIFAKHDMLQDPPFSNIDLVACRNVMIYLKPEVQEKLLLLFHMVLRTNGILCLGPSETVSGAMDWFEALSKRYRVYRRAGRHRPSHVEFPISNRVMHARPYVSASHRPPRPRVAEICRRLLLETFAPASALVTPRGEGLYYFGQIERYLKVPNGEAGQDLIAMAQEGLRSKLRTAIREARQNQSPVTIRGGSALRDGGIGPVTIAVQPVDADGEKLLLVSFSEAHEPPARARARAPRDSADAAAVEQLEQELSSAKDELRGSIRELEASNEELRAANEEAMSVNEELQSINEEVETSKEELQSLNEELTTLNTELQQRVEEQQRTTNNLSNILASTDVPTLFLDRSFHIRFFTPATRTLFTIIPTDVGRSISDLTRLIDDPTLLDDARHVLSSSKPSTREVRSYAGRWHTRQIRLYRSADNQVDGVVVTYFDINDLKVATVALGAARTFADSIVETVQYPLIVVDSELNILAASRAFYAMFQLQSIDVIGQALCAIATGAFGDKSLRRDMQHVFATGTPLEHHEIVLSSHQAGTRIFYLDARMNVAPPAGEKQTMLVTLVDVTAQRRAKDEQFQTFLDASPDTTLIADRTHSIAYVNRQAESLFGWSRAALIGKSMDLLLPPRFRRTYRNHVRQYFTGPTPRETSQRIEICGLTQDGREVPIEVSLAPVATERGTMVSAAIRDTSESVAAQESLRAARDTAEATNEAKSRFLAVASHDLRQPLQTLKFLQGVLARKIAEPEALDIVQKLGGTLAAMGDALDALLDLSQLETGAIKPSVDDISVAPILARLRNELEHRASEKGLRLRVMDCPATVRSDPRLLSHLVQNLGENAVKYTDEGGVLIGCRRRGSKLRIEVWDTGIGIPQSELRRIFEEYYQLRGRSTERARGFGLGLSVVQRLAALLDHRIDVRSTLGKGSMFAVELPLGRDERKGRAAGPDAMSLARPTSGLVLLVEDDPVLLGSLRMLIQAEGYRPLVATTAAQALDLVRKRRAPPDVLIADYNLTGGPSGAELAVALRRLVGRDVPAIILTGDTGPAAQKDLAHDGFIHLRKPIDSDALLETLRAAAAGAEVGGPAKPATRIAGGAESAAPVDPIVFVVDDDRSIRDALGSLLKAEGYRVEAYSNGEAFLNGLRRGVYGCALVDIGLPGIDGLALESNLSRREPNLSLIMITGRRDMALAVQAMRRGAVDFLEKPIGSETLLASVRAALAKAKVSLAAAAPPGVAERYGRLTGREREIMQLMTQGMATKEIARDLGLSPRTVEKHRARIMHKMATGRLADLVRMAVQIEAGG